MKTLKLKKGMTLVEIIVAIAVLAIVALVLLSIFTGAFSSILSMGKKTSAVARAQVIIDKVYETSPSTIASIQTQVETLGADADPFGDPSITGDEIRYTVSTKSIDGKNMTELTILVFYQNGDRHITLSALIP